MTQARLDDDYLSHNFFTRIDYLIEFYRNLSFALAPFLTLGTQARCFETYILSSIGATLRSIRAIAHAGRLNDSYALLRKYHDSAVINIYALLYLKENYSLETLVVKAIDDWIAGKKKLPEYREMSSYIKGSDRLGKLNKLLYSDTRYEEIRDRCNDHVHYNFFYHMLFNDEEVYMENRSRSLELLEQDLTNLVILHLSCLFYLENHYMMSSDYMDYHEVGATPPEGCQYWVAPYVNDLFKKLLEIRRPDIVELIKSESEMQFEEETV